MTAIERAAHMAEVARAKLSLHDWIVTRPGEEPFPVHLNPPQTQEWVQQHYTGCGIVRGNAT